MINPILGAANQSKLTSQITPIRNLMNMVRNAGNPQAMLNQVLQSNPQIYQLIQQNGGDAKSAFYAMAKQLGVDGDEVIGMLK